MTYELERATAFTEELVRLSEELAIKHGVYIESRGRKFFASGTTGNTSAIQAAAEVGFDVVMTMYPSVRYVPVAGEFKKQEDRDRVQSAVTRFNTSRYNRPEAMRYWDAEHELHPIGRVFRVGKHLFYFWGTEFEEKSYKTRCLVQRCLSGRLSLVPMPRDIRRRDGSIWTSYLDRAEWAMFTALQAADVESSIKALSVRQRERGASDRYIVDFLRDADED